MMVSPDCFVLRYSTTDTWVNAVLSDFDCFLNDHAQAEKKASGMAMSMLCHYSDRPQLVRAMADMAVEEMNHFREAIKLMQARGLNLRPDKKDRYINAIRNVIRDGREDYMLDRLLTAAIIEARGCERFSLIGEHHPEPKIARFYQSIATSEARHQGLFIDLSGQYFAQAEIDQRLDELLDMEADIIRQLPIRAALH